MEFNIPVFDTEVDTNEPGESAGNLAGALGGGVLLLGLIGGAQFVYNRVTDVAGVGENANVPGV